MIDWQLEYTFDNSLRFSIYRLGYSTLLMSTPVCSSACRRYEPLTVAVTLSYFAVFSYYMCWFIQRGSHLPILVSFYPLLLCLYAFCIFPVQFLQQLFCLCICTLQRFFQIYCSISGIFYGSFLRHFVVYFLYFSSSNIFCYTQVIYPHGIYLLLVAI